MGLRTAIVSILSAGEACGCVKQAGALLDKSAPAGRRAREERKKG